MWGGWEKNATPETKKAYQLNKMDNRWGLMGQAAENSVMRVLRQHQQFLDFLSRAACGHSRWLPIAENRDQHHARALQEWY